MLASLFNLAGPDLIVILLILIMLAAPLILIYLISTFTTRRNRGEPAPLPSSPPPLPVHSSVFERLQQLQQLRQQGVISESEYEEQRRRILSDI